jgi:ABC-2 type transport system permease protein
VSDLALAAPTAPPADLAPLVASPAPRPRSLARDALAMIDRSVRLSWRNVDAMITSLVLPIILMLLFVYLFGGAIQTGTRYVTYVVPGVILLCAAFGAAGTAVGVTQDMKTGIIDRFRSMDVSGGAVLTGHVVASLARNTASTLLVLGVAFLIGFRPHAGVLDGLAVAGVLLLFVLAISWLSAAVGLLAKSPEAAAGFTFVVMFLPYPSSAFVPIDTMPAWLHGFARHQPVTPVIETVRGLLLDVPVGDSPRQAVLWCTAITVASIALCVALFPRRPLGEPAAPPPIP